MKKITKHQVIIVIACMLIQAIPYGLSQNLPPLYNQPLVEVYHFKVVQVGLMFTIGAAIASLVSPVAGRFFGSMKTKILMLIGVAISTVGFIIQVFATSIELFWVATGLIQAGCIIFSGLAVPYLIGSWFGRDQRATAMGIAFAGGSIGNVFIQPIFNSLFTQARAEAVAQGGSVAPIQHIFFIVLCAFVVSALTIVVFLITDNKNDKTPNQTHKEQMDEVFEESVENVKGCGFEVTKKFPQFWLMGIAMFIIGLNIAAQSAQYNYFFNEMHINESVVGFSGSIFAISCLAGNVCGGIFFDKIGVRLSILLGGILQVLSGAAMLVIALNENHIGASGYGYLEFLPYAWAVMYGFSVFMYTSGPSVIIQKLFGMKDFGQTVGLFNIFFALGFALGATLIGQVIQSAGWIQAWGLVIAFAAIGFALMDINVSVLLKKKLYDK